MAYEDKNKRRLINNLSINDAVNKTKEEENLRKLYFRKIHELFYKSGLVSKSETLDLVYEELNDLITEYVNKGFDLEELMLYIRRGFEQREKINAKGKSR